jgi:hypothetical protein
MVLGLLHDTKLYVSIPKTAEISSPFPELTPKDTNSIFVRYLLRSFVAKMAQNLNIFWRKN